MKAVREYIESNRPKIQALFTTQGKDGEMPATNLHAFLRDVFKLQEIKFVREGKDYFKEDQSQAHTQKIVQQYYRTTPDGKKGKFYLYRITFTLEEVEEYLEYWLNTDRTISVQYQPKQGKVVVVEKAEKEEVRLAEELRESTILDNEFMDEHRIPMLREAYQKDIQNLQQILDKGTNSPEQSKLIQDRIDVYRQKLEQLELKATQPNPSLTNPKESQQKHSQNNKPSPPKSKTQASRPRKQANLKLVFQYYARQNHLTGVKQSFQWIQHETQTMNYQKLVHFLKEYQIFPQKPKAQKKLHNIYVRICSATRDLNYGEFLQLLEKLPEILYEDPQESVQQKKEKLMAKIEAGSEKNKLFHNPFHSLQKSNFRIDSQSLKYSFKLKPLQGKLQSQVNHQLQWRRRQKAEARQQAQREKEQRQVQKLRKLMAIDPYHPLVVKNSDLLNKRNASVPMQPIASLQNMQKFRDLNFDMKAQFGISDFQEDPLKQISKRYDLRRAQAVQKEQTQRMSVLMNGLIQRSQAKAQKFSLSPRKRQASSKLS